MNLDKPDECLSSSTFKMKWYFSSICLVLAWKTGFRANWMALWLSLCKTWISLIITKSPTRLVSHIASLHASLAATYCASVVDKVVHGYEQETHETSLKFSSPTCVFPVRALKSPSRRMSPNLENSMMPSCNVSYGLCPFVVTSCAYDELSGGK